MRAPVRTLATLLVSLAVTAGAQGVSAGARGTISLAGTVMDSLSNAVVPRARVALAGTSVEVTTNRDGRFVIPGVAAGKYTIEVHTTSLDSVGLVSETTVNVTDSTGQIRLRVPNASLILTTFCGTTTVLDGYGVVIGSLAMPGDSLLRRNVRVVAEWQEISVTKGRAKTLETASRWLETRVDSLGNYSLCGVPLNTALRLRPETDSMPATSPPSLDLLIPSEMLLAQANLTLELPRPVGTDQPSVFTGVVVSDSTQLPIGGVEVAFPDLGKRVVANDSGAFRLTDIPAGTHRLVVRHLGYGALTISVSFAGGRTVERRILLGRVVTLDSVRVKSTAFERRMESFEDNRKVGLGHFFTRAELAKVEHETLAAVMSTMPSVRVRSGRGGSYVSSTRLRSLSRPCSPLVYIDEVREVLPFNLDLMPLEKIEGIEYYTGPAQTPMKYSVLNSQCGVLVIWTRR